MMEIKKRPWPIVILLFPFIAPIWLIGFCMADAAERTLQYKRLKKKMR